MVGMGRFESVHGRFRTAWVGSWSGCVGSWSVWVSLGQFGSVWVGSWSVWIGARSVQVVSGRSRSFQVGPGRFRSVQVGSGRFRKRRRPLNSSKEAVPNLGVSIPHSAVEQFN